MGNSALKLTFATVFLFGFSELTFAGDCQSVADLTARLDCYDAELKRQQPPKVAQQTPIQRHCSSEADARALHGAEREAFRSRCKGDTMRELRSSLDKAFLSAGINVEVFSLSEKDEFTTGKLPQLQLFGYMNRATIYQIITKLDLIRTAREAGFKSLDMNGRGQARYIFDLGTTGRVCAKDLCF